MSRITLEVKEIARLIGVSQTTIYKMVSENQIPHVKVRGRILFHKETVEKWLRGELPASKNA